MTTAELAIGVDRGLRVPIYRQIGRQFAEMIKRGELRRGQRLPGVPQLVRELGVNYRTVRQAYQYLSQTGLVEIINGKGTFVADRTAAGRETRTIAAVGYWPLDVHSDRQDFLQNVYRGMRLEAERMGWSCPYMTPAGNLMETWRQARAAGMIVFATSSELIDPDGLRQAGVKAVTVSGSGKALPMVRSDDHAGIGAMMDHLFDLGHRRVAFVGASQLTHSVRRRMEAYCRKMGERGLSIQPSWIFISEDPVLQEWEEQERVYEQLFGSDAPPTAIVASSGYVSMSLLQLLHRHRVRIPEEVSVGGYDDLPAMRFAAPPLTTVRQPLEEIGREAVRKVVAMLEEREVEDTVLPVELVVRESTGRARES